MHLLQGRLWCWVWGGVLKLLMEDNQPLGCCGRPAVIPHLQPIRPFTLFNRQVLEELFIPEHPTYEPNTSGWAAEAAERLAPLAADGGSGELSAAERAAAAFVLIGQAEAAAWGGSNGSLGGGGSGGGSSQRRYTVADFRAAYALGALTPLHVAENIIAAVEASEARVRCARGLQCAEIVSCCGACAC